MGVGSLVVIALTSFFFLGVLEYLDTHPKRKTTYVVTETVGLPPYNSLTYPDDPNSLYAHLRAWDRHLLLWGMSPMFPTDPNMIGPIKVDPNGPRKYLVYGYDERGHLILKLETLRKEDVLERAKAKRE